MVRQLVYTMFISKNWASFNLRWKKNLLKHQKISKYYDCSDIKQLYCKVVSTKNVDWLCNCRTKESCPLDDKCWQTCIIYKADVISNKDSHIYCGASYTNLKFQYNYQTNSFRHRHHEQDKERSKHIWQLQDKSINFTLKWSITAYVSTQRCGSRRCDLFLMEKYLTARADQKNLLNKRTFQSVAKGIRIFLKISNNSLIVYKIIQ